MQPFLITYDLETINNGNRDDDYKNIREYIEIELNGKHKLNSVYLLISNLTANEILGKLMKFIKSGDKVLIIPISTKIKHESLGVIFPNFF